MACWASEVSECAGGISAEHYVSRTLWLSPQLTVSGLPGAKTPVTIGLNAAVTNALCRRHNEALSDLDTAAGDVVRAWRWLGELRHRRARSGPRTPYAITVDGWRFERWALKTLFGVASVLKRRLDGWTPGLEAARYAFGQGELPEGAGLYLLVREHENIANDERVNVHFGKRAEDTNPTAATINLRGGLRLLVTWDRPPAACGSAFALDGKLFSPDEAMRLEGIQIGTLNLRMRFDWARVPGKRVDPKLEALRRAYPSPAR